MAQCWTPWLFLLPMIFPKSDPNEKLATWNPMEMIILLSLRIFSFHALVIFSQQNLGWTTGIWANWKKQPASMEILNNKQRSFSSKRRIIPTGYWTWVRRFFFLRFAEYWYMTIQNQIFINLWTISTEWHKGLSVSWGLLSSDCGPNYRHGR